MYQQFSFYCECHCADVSQFVHLFPGIWVVSILATMQADMDIRGQSSVWTYSFVSWGKYHEWTCWVTCKNMFTFLRPTNLFSKVAAPCRLTSSSARAAGARSATRGPSANLFSHRAQLPLPLKGCPPWVPHQLLWNV